jgi:hypothetical protein
LKNGLIASVLVVVLVLGAAAGYLVGVTNGRTTSITVTTTVTQPPQVPQSTVVHSSVRLGLELTATITPAFLAEGQNVTIVAEVNNTSSSNVEANTTSVVNPAEGPCAQGFFTSLDVYSGNLSYNQLFNNRSNPSPLRLYNPSLVYTCPRMFNFTYVFYPHGAVARIQSDAGNGTKAVRETSVIGGYWTGSGQNYAFHSFPPGEYTVVVYDAWGSQKLIGYFQVGTV